MASKAVVTVYSGADAYRVTGRIMREYPKGLTVEDERGVIHYATFDRVSRIDERGAYLW